MSARIKRWWHRQLDVEAWNRRAVSPVNGTVMVLILASILADALETEPEVQRVAGNFFARFEMIVLAVFAAEYVLRVWVCTLNPRYPGWRGRLRYVASPYALLDLVALTVTLLAWSGSGLAWVRGLRVLRILKFARFGAFSLAIDTVVEVVQNRIYELAVSLALMALLILVAAAGIYVVEGEAQPDAFGSVPRSTWWAVATLTTIGYGDVTPQSVLGKTFAAIVSLAGIAFVAVPTGILAASFSEVVQNRKDRSKRDHQSVGR